MIEATRTCYGCSMTWVWVGGRAATMVLYPGLAWCNHLQRPKMPLVWIPRRNLPGGGVVKLPTLNSYIFGTWWLVREPCRRRPSSTLLTNHGVRNNPPSVQERWRRHRPNAKWRRGRGIQSASGIRSSQRRPAPLFHGGTSQSSPQDEATVRGGRLHRLRRRFVEAELRATPSAGPTRGGLRPRGNRDAPHPKKGARQGGTQGPPREREDVPGMAFDHHHIDQCEWIDTSLRRRWEYRHSIIWLGFAPRVGGIPILYALEMWVSFMLSLVVSTFFFRIV